jgi:hypothetical protein
MFVRQSAHNGQLVSAIFLRACVIIVIAAVFFIPAPPSARVTGALFLSFLLQCVFAIMRYVDYENDTALESLWLNHLTLRIALNDLPFTLDEKRHPIDWEKATLRAVEDIKQAKSDERLVGALTGGIASTLFFSCLSLALRLFDFAATAGVGAVFGIMIAGR